MTTHPTPLWTLDDALALVRGAEPHTARVGWHLALGGGVLHRGYSDHDLDVVAVPRMHPLPGQLDLRGTADIRDLHVALRALGWRRTRTAEQSRVYWATKSPRVDGKYVDVYDVEGRRVDVVTW